MEQGCSWQRAERGEESPSEAARWAGGSGERWGQMGTELDFVVKALAPLRAFWQMDDRGVSSRVKGED